MAWKNVPIALSSTFSSVRQSIVTNFDLLDLATWPSNLDSYITYDINDTSIWPSARTNFFGTGDYRVELWKSGNEGVADIITPGGTARPSQWMSASTLDWSFFACVDDDTQKGVLGFIYKPNISDTHVMFFSGAQPPQPSNSGARGYHYTLITQNQLVLYTWTSVPAMSGKMGIFIVITDNR